MRQHSLTVRKGALESNCSSFLSNFWLRQLVLPLHEKGNAGIVVLFRGWKEDEKIHLDTTHFRVTPNTYVAMSNKQADT